MVVGTSWWERNRPSRVGWDREKSSATSHVKVLTTKMETQVRGHKRAFDNKGHVSVAAGTVP